MGKVSIFSFELIDEFSIRSVIINTKLVDSTMKNCQFLLHQDSVNPRVFFHGHWRLTGQQGKRGDHLLFHSTTSTRSRTFRHLFATLHVRWLSHIFNRTACIYQTATRWDLLPYRITIWLIDDVTLVFFMFAFVMIWS